MRVPKYYGYRQLVDMGIPMSTIKKRFYVSDYPERYGIVIIGGVKMVSEKDFEKFWKHLIKSL
jgi:hypothetical protein